MPYWPVFSGSRSVLICGKTLTPGSAGVSTRSPQVKASVGPHRPKLDGAKALCWPLPMPSTPDRKVPTGSKRSAFQLNW